MAVSNMPLYNSANRLYESAATACDCKVGKIHKLNARVENNVKLIFCVLKLKLN